MHVSSVKLPQQLRQGSIFNFKNLKFKIEKEKNPVGFDYFYKEVDLDEINYGIVITQDCDCVHEQKKVTHLNVGILEPINRKKRENPLEIFDIDEKKFICEFLDFKFYVEDEIGKTLKQKMSKLVDNDSSHFLFIEIESKFYYLNLTKIFPLKFQHYGDLLNQTEFELSNGFNFLLGWKMANMFGRVGVDIYEPKKREQITKKIVTDISKVIFKDWPSNTYSMSKEQYDQIKGDLTQFGQDTNNQKIMNRILAKLTEFGYIKK